MRVIDNSKNYGIIMNDWIPYKIEYNKLKENINECFNKIKWLENG